VSEPLVADRRLHPASFGIRFIKNVPEFVVGFPAIVGFSSDAGAPLIILLICLGAAAALGAAWLSWRRFRYGVGDRDIVIESGVFQRQRRIIPFDRIQDIDIEQRLLARLFGVVTVRVETGGAGKDEGRLEAVALAEAHRLRDIIRSRGRGNPGESAPAAAADEPLLFAMTLPRLLLAGLFNFSLIFLAAIGVAFQNLQPLFDARDIDPLELLGFAGAAAGQVTIAGSLVLLALLLLLGVISGIVRTVLADYGFRLWRSRSGLRRARGLLTRSEIVIPLARIQLALLRSGPVSRLLGWLSLHYQTLSADAAASGHQSVAPFARMAEIMPILAETGHSDLPPPEAYVQVSRLSVARRSLRYLLPLAAATIALAIAFRPGFLLLALFPLLVGVAVLQWKRHRYAISDRMLFVSQGLLDRRLWIVPFDRAQTISVSRTLFQRVLGLASVTVDTAGAGMLHHPVIVDLDASAAESLGALLLERHKAARLTLRHRHPA
jgi:putative membrane protein